MKQILKVPDKHIYGIAVFIMLFTVGFLFAENNESLSDSYRRNFTRANLTTKIELLNSAVQLNDMLPLYKDALSFFSASYNILPNDPQLLEIGTVAVNMLRKLQDKSSAQDIRILLSRIPNEDFKITCLKACAVLMEPDTEFTSFLNKCYEDLLNNIIAGKLAGIKLLIAYTEILGRFKDPSSYYVLFKTLLYPTDENLTAAVKKTLHNISFNYLDEIIAGIEKNDLKYTYTLFLLAKENPQLEPVELGKITAAVFSAAVIRVEENAVLAKKLISESLNTFAALKWSKASDIVIKYFYKVQLEIKTGKADIKDLIPVITCMGYLGSAQAAQVLSVFLGTVNTETERKKTYNEPLVLSLISALGQLGNKTAFDYLLYVDYLNYSDTVKRASRAAIAELSW